MSYEACVFKRLGVIKRCSYKTTKTQIFAKKSEKTVKCLKENEMRCARKRDFARKMRKLPNTPQIIFT